MVETGWVDHVVVDHLDVDGGAQELDEFPQLRASNTIGTIDSQRSLYLDSPHDLLEGLRQLLIVTLLGRLAVLVLCSEGVLAAHDIVELRGGHVLEVDEFDLGCGQRGIEHSHQARTRGTGIASKDHSSRVGHLDIDFLHEFIVDVGNGLQRGICQLCRVCLPLSLNMTMSLENSIR